MPFTVDTIKSYGVTSPDAVIQGEIDAFVDTYSCLNSSYATAKADLIANKYIAGSMLAVQGGQVTSQKAPNGASKNFKSSKYGDSGEYDHSLIKQAYLADTAGCLPVDDTEFVFGVAGTTYEADNPQ